MLDDGEETVEKQAPAAEGWMVILAFVSGMLVMYLLRYLPSPGWKKSIRHYSESEALKILYPHINESPEIEEMVRKLYAKKAGDKNVKIDRGKPETECHDEVYEFGYIGNEQVGRRGQP